MLPASRYNKNLVFTWWACKSLFSVIHCLVRSTLSGTVKMCLRFSIAVTYCECLIFSSRTSCNFELKSGTLPKESSSQAKLRNFNQIIYTCLNEKIVYFCFISWTSFSEACSWFNPTLTPSSWLCIAVFSIDSTDAFFLSMRRLYWSTYWQ